MLADVPLHIVVAPPGLIFVGNILTVTSTVNVLPAQPLAVGVTVYLRTPPDVLVSVWLIVVPQLDEQLPAPLTLPDWFVEVQVNVVPLTVAFNSTSVVVPEQMLTASAEPTGLGRTTIVAVRGAPSQKAGAGPVGIIVNVTVTLLFVVLVSVAEEILPVPLAGKPVTSLTLSRVQVYVVPLTVGLVPNAIVVNDCPEHIF